MNKKIQLFAAFIHPFWIWTFLILHFLSVVLEFLFQKTVVERDIQSLNQNNDQWHVRYIKSKINFNVSLVLSTRCKGNVVILEKPYFDYSKNQDHRVAWYSYFTGHVSELFFFHNMLVHIRKTIASDLLEYWLTSLYFYLSILPQLEGKQTSD